MAPMRLMRHFAPGMAERGWGRIVNVTSTRGQAPVADLAGLLRRQGRAALAVARVTPTAGRRAACSSTPSRPGPTGTPLWLAEGGLADQARRARRASAREEAIAAQAAKVPLGRFGEPDEVAAVDRLPLLRARLVGHRRGLVGRRRHLAVDALPVLERPGRDGPSRRARPARRSGRRAASSSSWVPRSTIRPPSRTTIWSASRTVESRWAMTIVVRPSARPVERLLDGALGLHVERAGGLVEDEHGRVAQDRARDRDALLLAAGEAVAALADDGVVAVGQRGDRGRGSGRRAPPPRSRRRWRRAARSAGSRARRRGRGRSPARRRRPRRRARRRSARARRCRRCAPRRARGRRAGRRGSRAWSCPSRSRRRSRCACRPGTSRSTPRERPVVVARSGTRRRRRRRRRAAPRSVARARVDVDRQVEVLEDALEQRERGLQVDADAEQRLDREEEPRLQRGEGDDACRSRRRRRRARRTGTRAPA